MADSTTKPITQILAAVATGNKAAENELLAVVFDELHRLARLEAARDGHNRHQPTTLVNEAYVRLNGPNGTLTFNNRAHFFTAAAIAMRRICIDDARKRGRVKRGDGRLPVALPDDLAAPQLDQIDMLALDEALSRLELLEPRYAQIVSLRFFAERNREEIAEMLEISPRTVDEDWRFARAWLLKEMSA